MKAILAALVTLTLCTAADLAPNAWSNTSWGMTAQQIKTAFPAGQVVDLPATDENTFRDGMASLGIGSVPIEGTAFRVAFLSGASGLREVILSPVDSSAPDESLFHKIEAALTLKYGSPFPTTEKDDTFVKLTSQWKTPSTVIQLQYVDFISLGDTKLLTLDYSPISKNGYL